MSTDEDRFQAAENRDFKVFKEELTRWESSIRTEFEEWKVDRLYDFSICVNDVLAKYDLQDMLDIAMENLGGKNTNEVFEKIISLFPDEKKPSKSTKLNPFLKFYLLNEGRYAQW